MRTGAPARQRSRHSPPALKLLCISDHRDPLVYSPRVKERFGDVDAVIGAGDLSFDYYDFVLSSLNKPLFFVFGNHNLDHLGHFSQRAASGALPITGSGLGPALGGTYVGGRVHTERLRDGTRLLVAGLGGCRRYNDGDNQFSERAMAWRVLRMTPRLWFNRIRYGRCLDILVTHAPPRGIGDREDQPHQGFRAFLRFIRRFRPRCLIHGHIHLYDRNERREYHYAGCKVVNAYDHCVVELGEAPSSSTRNREKLSANGTVGT